MIVLDSIIHTAIDPAFHFLPKEMDSDAARVQLLTIGLQESRFEYRVQKTNDPYRPGPARGFWQNERGGVQCVLTNLTTQAHAKALCTARGVPFDAALVHAKLEFDDILAAGMARLFLWADRKPLPGLDADHETAWQCYLRCWNPGHPRRETWDAFHEQARAQVMS